MYFSSISWRFCFIILTCQNLPSVVVSGVVVGSTGVVVTIGVVVTGSTSVKCVLTVINYN